MIRGLVLGISLSVFIVSLVFFVSGASGALTENLITGAVIGPTQTAEYSIIGMFISGIGIFLTLFSIKK